MGSVPVGRKKRADTTGGPQTFRSPTAVVIWWVWLLFAAANLIDLAVQGRDHLSLVAAAILVLATGVAYVTAQRPRIVADSSGITVVNPLRDHHVGWAGVTKVDLADLLRVHCRGEPGQREDHLRLGGALLPAPQARRGNQGAPAGRAGQFRPPVPGHLRPGQRLRQRPPRSRFRERPGAGAPSSAEADAERIVRVLSEYATAARAEEIWADGTVEIAGARSGPAANRPGSNRPGSSRPGSNRPGSNRPGSNRPGSNRPGTLPQIPASRAGSSR